jgi:hypothetical protein
MLAWSIGRVGLIDITVGNAVRLGASQRSTTRRCALHHIATQRASRWEHPGGSRVFSSGPDPSNAHAMTSNERFWQILLQKSQKAQRLISRQRTKQAKIADQ